MKKNMQVYMHVCIHTKSLQSCPALCDPVDDSPPGSSVHGILQARILELPFPSPGDFPSPEIQPIFLLLNWQACSFTTSAT